ncbi:MAG: hypothetical protein LC737_10980, partial [Chloroflexi bacterium]|nr:hypothetical protein [Chloroflexota bacterium]
MPGSSNDLADSHFTLKFKGAEISNLQDAVLQIVVDSNLHMPSMFTIELYDELKDQTAFTWIDSTHFALGTEVEISVEAASQGGRSGEKGTLMKGEITALEPNFDEHGRATLTIRGYDKSHRLHRGKKTRTWLKKKDSDLISELAGDAGLSPSADTTTVQHDYLLQNNLTNMEFLQQRAQALGYQVFTTDGKLHFKKESFKLGVGPELIWNDTLRSFKPRLNGVKQADTAVVRGWDPKAKKIIESKVTPIKPANQAAISDSGGAASKKAYQKPSEIVITDMPVQTVDEAKAIATSVGNQINSEFVQAEGVCWGDPR